MTDDLVARLSTDAAARRLPEFIKTLRINRAKRRESVYAADNVYALLDALDTAEARVRELEDRISVLERDLDAQSAGHRLSANEATKHLMRVSELEAENKRLAERLDLLAVGFGVPDGGRYIADWQTKIDKLKAAERELAEAYERCAKVAETEGVYPEMNVHGGGPGWYRHGLRISAAIRKLAQAK